MDMSDDVLGLILERVDSPVSLIRAAAVCRRWRRAVADPAFLRRFRSLRAATAVAGHYHNDSHLPPLDLGAGASASEGPVFVPSSPPVVDARHFSLDFLEGDAGAWTVLDSRGSLLLMKREGPYDANSFRGLVVCEPLTRRCKVIPPPADFSDDHLLLGSCLVDGCLNEVGSRISMSNFRVHCMCRGHSHLCAAICTWANDMGLLWIKTDIDHSASSITLSQALGHAGGSWWFYVEGGTLIELDGSTGTFSNSVLPPLEDWDSHMWKSNFFVTNGRDGKPYIVTAFNDTMNVFVLLNGCEWALEKSICQRQPNACRGTSLVFSAIPR